LQEPHNHLIERRAMTSEQLNQPATTDLARHTSAPLPHWSRPLAIATAIVFCISSAFPVVAGFVTNRETWPRWWGVLDVAIAFVLAMLAFAVIGFAQGKVNKPVEDASYRAYRVLSHGIFVMPVVFFLFGDRIVWSNCLTGFAWRAWLLFYGLPAWLTALGATAGIGRFPEE
jgi:VIT1/CCC1 family predicted Fe2+/Mn2+ transporter